MRSAHLLAILRTYWRLARPEHRLFPGRDATRPIEPTTLHAACRSSWLQGRARGLAAPRQVEGAEPKHLPV
ncbi:MAG: hypothetical protein U1E40_15655 [Amaricoccus sp.]